MAVIVITYGHKSDEISKTLASTQRVAATGAPIKAYIVDDSSGCPPYVNGAETLVTPAQQGYAAAVNYVVTRLGNCVERLVFINPDAELDSEGLARLCWPRTSDRIIVPAIVRGDRLDNVRSTLRPVQVLRQLLAARFSCQILASNAIVGTTQLLGDPWVPTGTIIAFPVAVLKKYPLRAEMFWLEMSAWARENKGLIEFDIANIAAEHIGGSSKSHASSAVAASELSARCAFVQRYGSLTSRLILRPTAAAGLCIHVLLRVHDRRFAMRLWSVVKREMPWQTAARNTF